MQDGGGKMINDMQGYTLKEIDSDMLCKVTDRQSSNNREMIGYLQFVMKRTGVCAIMLKEVAFQHVNLLFWNISYEHQQVLEEQLQCLATIYYGNRLWNWRHCVSVETFALKKSFIRKLGGMIRALGILMHWDEEQSVFRYYALIPDSEGQEEGTDISVKRIMWRDCFLLILLFWKN